MQFPEGLENNPFTDCTLTSIWKHCAPGTQGSTGPMKVDLLGLFTLVSVDASNALDSALSSLMIKNS